MSIDLTEISQKVLDNNTNAANVFRKQYDLHYNSDAIDVPFEYIDENGIKQTTNIPNVAKFRKRVWDDVGAALGQFNRTFYVDAENGDDNNDGSSGSPFKTIRKAIDNIPVGGRGLIYLSNDKTYYIGGTTSFYIYKKDIIIRDIGDGDNNPKIICKAWLSGDTNYYAYFQGENYRIKFSGVDIEDEPANSDDGNNTSWGIFGRSIAGILEIEFYNCNVNIKYATLITSSNDAYLIKLSLRSSIFQMKNNILVLGYGANAILREYDCSFKDEDGNDISLNDRISGIVKDSDSGNPINLISNINFSD